MVPHDPRDVDEDTRFGPVRGTSEIASVERTGNSGRSAMPAAATVQRSAAGRRARTNGRPSATAAEASAGADQTPRTIANREATRTSRCRDSASVSRRIGWLNVTRRGADAPTPPSSSEEAWSAMRPTPTSARPVTRGTRSSQQRMDPLAATRAVRSTGIDGRRSRAGECQLRLGKRSLMPARRLRPQRCARNPARLDNTDGRDHREDRRIKRHTHRQTPDRRHIDRENGWGTWIRTKINGVRVRCSTVELSPMPPCGMTREARRTVVARALV